jgi:uncharacterized Zn-finger protein
MPEIEEIEIHCSSCKNWFASPIGFVNAEGFDSETAEHKTVECPFCGQIVRCDKKNTRVKVEGKSK